MNIRDDVQCTLEGSAYDILTQEQEDKAQVEMKTIEHSEMTLDSIDSTPLVDYDQILNFRMGQGSFQRTNMVPLYFSAFLDGCEVMILTYIVPIFQSLWGISRFQESLITNSIFIGMIFGCLIGGYLGDRWGRKPVIILGLLLNIVFSSLSALSSDVSHFVMCRCMATVGHGLGSSVGSCYTSEICTSAYKAYYIILTGCYFLMGCLLVTLVALFSLDTISSGNWQQLIYLISITGSISLLFLHQFHESPRFHLVKRHFEQAFQTIDKCIMENNPMGEPLTSQEKDNLRTLYSRRLDLDQDDHSTSYMSLFQPQYIQTTLLASLQWFGINFMSYGCMFILPFLLKQIEQQEGHNQPKQHHHKLLELVYSNIPSMFFNFSFLFYSLKEKNMDQKMVINLSYLLGIIFLSLSLLFTSMFLPFFMIGKCVFGIIFTCLYIYTAHLFPTSVRSKAIGFCSFVARIGGIIMPFFFYNLVELGVRPTVMAILGLTVLFAGLSLRLPHQGQASDFQS